MSTQPDLLLGLELKEQGQAQVAEHNPDFVSTLREVAWAIALKNGRVTSDDLRLYADKHGLAPAHQNAWGAIFNGPEWEVIGHTRSVIPSNHGRTIKVFRRRQ